MGGQAITVLYYDLEYENVLKTGLDKKTGLLKIGGKGSKPGIRTTKRTRSVGCSNMKSMLENGLMEVKDLETIYELGNFILKDDKYQADNGCHDDTVMTLVIASWLYKQQWFIDEFGRNVSTELYNKATDEGSFKLPLVGGTNNEVETEVSTSGISVLTPETSGQSIEDWMRN
jgi:hypothetical protein